MLAIFELRTNIIKKYVDLHNARILEIGAFDRPTFDPKSVNIKFLDYRSSEQLRTLAKTSPGRDVSKVVDVDYVLNSNRISDELDEEFDLVIANHVIEHAPNLIGWLSGVASILSERGNMFISVPDRRFTFDYLRRETLFIDVLRSYRDDVGTPTFWNILEARYYQRPIVGAEAWHPEILNQKLEQKRFDWKQAIAQAKTEAELPYCDVHCSVFTRQSFEALFKDLDEVSLNPFTIQEISDVRPGNLEFHVMLRRKPNFSL